MNRGGRVACVLPLLCLPLAATAQRVSSSLDVGGAAMRYADSVNANGGAVAPALVIEWPRATLGGAAMFSRFPTGWSSQGALNGSVFSASIGPLVGEMAATAGGSAHQDGTRTGQGLGTGRGHLMTDNGGAWVGLGAGRTWDGAVWRGLTTGEIGAWTRAGGATFVASVAPTSVDDSVRYTDSQRSGHWAVSSTEVGGEIGLRSGDTGASIGGSGRHWGSIAITRWLAPRVGVILSGGTYPIDLTQGFPGGRFLTLSVRFRSAPSRQASDTHQSNAGMLARAAATEMVKAFQALPVARGRGRIDVRVPRAATVELSGDFTGWKAVPLVATPGDAWRISLPIAPGTHQVNIRVNGGRWMVPPGLPPILDEFGGAAGLLVVAEETPVR